MNMLKIYVKLGIPSALMTYFDFWIYTILLFISSKMGATSNAAQVILFNITSAVYAIGLGFGQSVCTKVGNNVGKSKPDKAKYYVAVGMILMQILNLVLSLMFFLNPTIVLSVYSDDT
jgi:MATE family multidrug resistance protein